MRRTISTIFALVLALSLCLVPAVVSATTTYDSSLTLENKDGSWAVITDTTSGTLQYNSSGSEFEYSFSAIGLEADTDYSLIYYADKDDRYVNWGGNNPGALIATFKSDGSSNIAATSGSTELNMNLPTLPDANISLYDYTDAPDNYTNAHGAKIWLVPSDCYTEPEVDVWSPSRFLFETDLISYDDIDVTSLGLDAELEEIIAISVTPTFIHFGDIEPGDEPMGDTISVENVGTVQVDVDADLDPLTGTVFNYLKLNGAFSPSYSGTWLNKITDLDPSEINTLTTQLDVPPTYSAQGVETATLVFTAGASS